MSSSPNHHSGMEYNVSAVPVEVRSKVPPRPQAERIPRYTPISVASTVDVPTSSRVGQIRSPTSSATGTRYRREMPRSPLKVFRRNVKNCCSSGWSRPYVARN